MYLKKRISLKIYLKIQYANEFVEQMGIGDTTTCVYQFIYYEKYSVYTEIIQYFIIHGLIIFIKVNSFVAHMFYAWSFSHNTAVPIAINKNRFLLFLDTNTTVFYLGSGNSNKIDCNN